MSVPRARQLAALDLPMATSMASPSRSVLSVPYSVEPIVPEPAAALA